MNDDDEDNRDRFLRRGSSLWLPSRVRFIIGACWMQEDAAAVIGIFSTAMHKFSLICISSFAWFSYAWKHLQHISPFSLRVSMSSTGWFCDCSSFFKSRVHSANTLPQLSVEVLDSLFRLFLSPGLEVRSLPQPRQYIDEKIPAIVMYFSLATPPRLMVFSPVVSNAH